MAHGATDPEIRAFAHGFWKFAKGRWNLQMIAYFDRTIETRRFNSHILWEDFACLRDFARHSTFSLWRSRQLDNVQNEINTFENVKRTLTPAPKSQ